MINGEIGAPRRLFFRIVRTDPPDLADFLSNAALGRPPRRPTPEVLRLWDGISVYETEQQARVKALQFPQLGGYVARLAIPPGLRVRAERTTSSEGHHTLWASAAILHSCVVDVVPV
jgi:hypothetical protein